MGVVLKILVIDPSRRESTESDRIFGGFLNRITSLSVEAVGSGVAIGPAEGSKGFSRDSQDVRLLIGDAAANGRFSEKGDRR